MTKPLISLAALCALTLPSIGGASAQEASNSSPGPNAIVADAPSEEWNAIPAKDLLLMTLAPDAQGNPREVVIQLISKPFSQGWVANIRKFATSGWYDNTSVNRVQDNYVVQWGDANYDNPEATGEPKPLPEGLVAVPEGDYTAELDAAAIESIQDYFRNAAGESEVVDTVTIFRSDPYARANGFFDGWPIAMMDRDPLAWPVHCYGMVGVGRGYSPDTGSGAELYTVIGQAPRHLDRNVALVGRVIEGIEHLSSLPRGEGQLGFYEDATRRTAILSVRLASSLGEDMRPAFEYLDTSGQTFSRYAEARSNRRDPFFNVPAGGADICNVPVPIRRVAE